MRILSLDQGSDAWLEHRANTLNASEAPAMMGVSPYMTRAELMRLKHDGAGREIDAAMQKRFDDGHRAEAAARPIAEEIIGEELYPATVTDDDGRLSASLDGATMSYKVLFEHKLTNEKKVEAVEAGECPDCDYPQVQQQLMITGAEKCLYAVSDGTRENFVSCWVYPDEEYQQKLLAGWDQLEADLADYTPPKDEHQAVGSKMSDLPARRVEVEGKVLATNVDQFRDHALAVFDGISTELATDQDFADAEETVKWCKSVEDQLEHAKKQALSQTASIDELFRAIDEIKETARQKRLDLDKRVKARKSEIRTEIADEARAKFSEHMESLSERVKPASMPAIPTDFAGAMKGKRTIKSLRDAVDQVLADAKLEANAVADRIDANLRAYNELAGGYDTLFPDLSTLAQKEPEDFQAAVKLRITEHKEAEARREEERRQAEEAQRQREAAEKDAPKGAEPATEAPTNESSDARSGLGVGQAVEKSGTGEKATERWRVTVGFEFDAPVGSNGDALADAIKGKLVAAGFQSIADAVAEKLRKAA